MRDSSEIKQRFLKALGDHIGSVKAACEAVGISDQNYRYWRKTDAEFAEQCDLIRQSHRSARTEARRAALEAEKTAKAEERVRLVRSTSADADSTGLAYYEGTPFAELCAKAVERITEALTARGIYDEGMKPHIELLARATANLEVMLWQVDQYAPLQVEYSREGNAKLVTNPLHGSIASATESLSRQYAKMGLTYDPKRETGADARDFISRFNDD